MCCFAEDNKIISGIENTIAESDKTKQIFNTLSVGCGCRPGNNLLTPSTLYKLGHQ